MISQELEIEILKAWCIRRHDILNTTYGHTYAVFILSVYGGKGIYECRYNTKTKEAYIPTLNYELP